MRVGHTGDGHATQSGRSLFAQAGPRRIDYDPVWRQRRAAISEKPLGRRTNALHVAGNVEAQIGEEFGDDSTAST